VASDVRIYWGGVTAGFLASLIELAWAGLGACYLVWLGYGAAAVVGLLAIPCSPPVRPWVLLLGFFPPAGVGFLFLLFLYPSLHLLIPFVLLAGAATSFDIAQRDRVRVPEKPLV
jgi:hypothetical protein